MIKSYLPNKRYPAIRFNNIKEDIYNNFNVIKDYGNTISVKLDNGSLFIGCDGSLDFHGKIDNANQTISLIKNIFNNHKYNFDYFEE